MSKLLLYCTKTKPYLQINRCVLPTEYDRYILSKEQYYSPFGEPLDRLNGKIVAECDFEVDVLTNHTTSFMIHKFEDMMESYRYTNKIARGSCLDFTDLKRYLKDKNGYAIHIKNLHIFDKPRDIRNYYNIAPRTMQDCMNQRALVKAPQNMCNAYDVYKNHYILISIRPEWLCKILNREKTIEVRKKVLKEMLKNE